MLKLNLKIFLLIGVFAYTPSSFSTDASIIQSGSDLPVHAMQNAEEIRSDLGLIGTLARISIEGFSDSDTVLTDCLSRLQNTFQKSFSTLTSTHENKIRKQQSLNNTKKAYADTLKSLSGDHQNYKDIVQTLSFGLLNRWGDRDAGDMVLFSELDQLHPEFSK